MHFEARSRGRGQQQTPHPRSSTCKGRVRTRNPDRVPTPSTRLCGELVPSICDATSAPGQRLSPPPHQRRGTAGARFYASTQQSPWRETSRYARPQTALRSSSVSAHPAFQVVEPGRIGVDQPNITAGRLPGLIRLDDLGGPTRHTLGSASCACRLCLHRRSR